MRYISRALERKFIEADRYFNDVFLHVWQGRFVDVQQAAPEMAQAYYQSYIDNYLIADAINEKGIKDIAGFKRFIRAAAALTGSLSHQMTDAGNTAGWSCGRTFL